ncbi:MAG: hypothetical protein ACK4IX_00540 [Candidatus Sericytochromatia bacterium]
MILSDLLFSNDGEKYSISINGKKVELGNSNILKTLKDNLDNDSGKEVIKVFTNMPNRIANQEISYSQLLKLTNSLNKATNNKLDEINKSVYGICINKTTKDFIENLLDNMQDKEGVTIDNFSIELKKMGLTIFFSSENIVKELVVMSPFRGETLKGLKIGDDITKAIELYGQPKIRSLVSAFWSNFSVFLKDEIISSIKLRN